MKARSIKYFRRKKHLADWLPSLAGGFAERTRVSMESYLNGFSIQVSEEFKENDRCFWDAKIKGAFVITDTSLN